VQIAKGKAILANVDRVLHAEQDCEMRTLQNNLSTLVKNSENVARQIPTALANKVDDNLLEEAIEIRHAEKSALVHEKRLSHSRALEGGHGREVELMEKKHDQWLKEAQAEGQRLAMELENCRERHQDWHKHVRGELLDAHGIARQLSTILDALEGGVPVPSHILSEIRPPA
jgi:hypothetical protein